MLVDREPAVVETLVSGGSGSPFHEPLRHHSAEIAAPDAIIAIGKETR